MEQGRKARQGRGVVGGRKRWRAGGRRMTSRRAALFLAVAGSALLGPPLRTAGADPYRITRESRQIPGSKLREVKAEAHFPFPPQQVWRLLSRTHDFPAYLPRVLVCESQGRLRGREHLYVVFNLPWPLTDIWNVVALARDPAERRFDWELVEGNLKQNSGSLRVMPEESGSVLKFEVRVETGLLPPWIATWGARHYVPKALKAIAERLEAEKGKGPAAQAANGAAAAHSPVPPAPKAEREKRVSK